MWLIISLLVVVFVVLKLSENKLYKVSNFFLFCLLGLVLVEVYREIQYNQDFNNKELFTPRIREMYRPHLRNARIYSEGLIGKKRDDFNRLYRQLGL